ncbi:MAG: hypothetical protein M3Q85_09780, partial [Acidobacteriota bacterium]|nr:hypothetical protein [Acidobacteriota bacterium]
MNVVCRVAAAVGLAAIVAVPSFAQQPASPPGTTGPAAAQPPDPADPDDPKYEETVVVSGSRAQEKLVNTPVTMTVIGPRQIET